MTETERNQLSDPHVFSGELHFALLNEGLRGPRMRELLSLARGDSELGRIFEMKVAEFRRFLRESRAPTWWNLPQRGWEWLADNAQFTPPREVFLTLVYVVLVLIGFEAAKRKLIDRSPATSPMVQAGMFSGGGASYSAGRPSDDGEVAAAVEKWMLAELKIAAESPAWRNAIAQQLAAGVEKAGIEDMLRRKVEAVLSAPEFQAELERKLNEAISSRAVAKPEAISAGPEKVAAEPAAPQTETPPGDAP